MRLPITSPTNSLGVVTSTVITGSSSTGPAFRQAASKPMAPAASKARGVEVAGLYTASSRVTRTSMVG